MPASPLSVAFLTDAPRVAGSEVWLRDLLPLLPALGVAPTLYLPQRETLHRFAADLYMLGLEVVRYHDLAELPRLTTDHDLRVLQAWEPGSYNFLLPRLARPRVVVSHDQLDYHYPLPLQATYRQIFRVTKGRAFAQADGVITVSAWGAQFLRELGLKKVEAMTNGADPERFFPATSSERERLRQGLGWQRFTVLVPGRFTPEKNQLAAVWAARHAPQLDFVFAGDMDSALGGVAQSVGRRLANVTFLGRRWDMPELYRAADALLQPTLAENQSLVTLEAMSSGLPIVTTDIPAQRELVHDGVTGLTVKPQPELLALALTALAQHPQRAAQMGQAARAHILSHHTTHQSAARLAELLRRAAGVHA